ncbi:kinetochore-associated protein KNL-2 homolog isoform X2 [Ziziphus jujuba]|uniref:Kinetochore-associated protein KNL-2 homolog isoform X2 n=1 Tax=Ziziphus jujuba TaxID=326968 RepID=A0ABM3I4K8_ZIZJJ|nr:kinetochore-associated protein KNL-2 homolog isoform X2 [Ziziphus jujuba]
MASNPGSNQTTDKTDNEDDGLSSRFQTTVCLQEWWLIKAEDDFQKKRLAIAGFTSREQRAVRVFSSAPIAKRYDTFTVETVDGICVIIKGFINKQRTTDNGFPSEVFSHFVFGFPSYWEQYAAKFLEQDSFSGLKNSTPTSAHFSKSESPNKCEHTIYGDRKEAEVSEDLFHKVSANIEIGALKVSNADGRIDQVNITTTSVRRSNRLHNDELNDGCVKDGLHQTSYVKREHKFRNRKTQGSVQNVLTSQSEGKKSHIKDSNIAAGEGETYSKDRSSSRKKPKRKLSFDTHVTPRKLEAQVNISVVSPESSSFKRSRSGRLLLPTLEFWRNQMPIYDADHKLIGIQEAERPRGLSPHKLLIEGEWIQAS